MMLRDLQSRDVKQLGERDHVVSSYGCLNSVISTLTIQISKVLSYIKASEGYTLLWHDTI
jgi:hypothetical protein